MRAVYIRWNIKAQSFKEREGLRAAEQHGAHTFTSSHALPDHLLFFDTSDF